MARQTSVQLSVENPQTGNVVVEAGSLVGNNNRFLTLKAVPLPGYKFSEWQITEFPLRLYPANFIARYSTETEACSNANSDVPIGEVFYLGQVDGKLYTSSEGDLLVQDGVWYLGNFQYLVVTGNAPGIPQICDQQTTRGGASTGGNRTTGGREGGGQVDLSI